MRRVSSLESGKFGPRVLANTQRAKIIALVRTEIYKPRDSSRESGKLGPRVATSVSAL